MRVLHIISKLDAGGIEKWLLDLSKSDDKHEHYVLCISGEKGCWHEKVERKFTYPNIKHGKVSFLSNLRRFVIEHKFDIVHSHLYRFSSIISLALIGINKRMVCHSHNDKRTLYHNANKISAASIYGVVSKLLFNLLRSTNIAASRDAGEDLFGGHNFTVIRCGLDFNKSIENAPRRFNDNRIKVLTIGSLTKQKNHEFLIRIFANKELENYDLDIIGEGELRGSLEKIIDELGLHERVNLLGIVNNPIGNIKSYDKFVFPSLYEGLGLALIEAQSTGIPCIISDTVPLDADIVLGNIKRVSLTDESSWRDSLVNFESTISEEESKELVLNSEFNIERAIKTLDECYGK
ncbi:TPA: glycosyltransferase [Vibrio campbellii]|nr:glycosyltransferase [Vibrio campbellii]